jgi:hypothetical protein
MTSDTVHIDKREGGEGGLLLPPVVSDVTCRFLCLSRRAGCYQQPMDKLPGDAQFTIKSGTEFPVGDETVRDNSHYGGELYRLVSVTTVAMGEL